MSIEKDKRSLAAPQQLISAIIYLALIGVVIYGTHHYVYDGFGVAVPWIIGIIFGIMAIVRLFGFIASIRAQRTLEQYNRSREDLDDPELFKSDNI